MRRTVLTVAAMAALCAPAAPAAAQALTADQSDARCLMVLQVIARDPKQTAQASKGIYYYLGRVAARGPVGRLEAVLKAEVTKMNQAQAKTEVARCGAELNSRSQEFQGVNNRLAAALGPKAPPPPAKKP